MYNEAFARAVIAERARERDLSLARYRFLRARSTRRGGTRRVLGQTATERL
jgi:hypothetical protein